MSLKTPIHEFGNLQAPPLMLLHPGGALHSVWLPLIRSLSSQYHILAPDLVQKNYKKVSLQDLATEIITIIQQTPGKPMWLIGSSLGANVALLVTTRAPHLVAGLILDSSQTGGKPPVILRMIIRFLKSVLPIFPQSLITALLLRQFSNYAQSDKVAIRAELQGIRKTDFLEQIEAHFEYDVRQSLNKITVPTLIIAGEGDMLTKSGEPKKLHLGIKSSSLKIIPKAGHVTFLQQPLVFEKIVSEFLNTHISN